MGYLLSVGVCGLPLALILNAFRQHTAASLWLVAMGSFLVFAVGRVMPDTAEHVLYNVALGAMAGARQGRRERLY